MGLGPRPLSFSFPLRLLYLSFLLARYATARSWFALSGASRTADEDTPVYSFKLPSLSLFFHLFVSLFSLLSRPYSRTLSSFPRSACLSFWPQPSLSRALRISSRHKCTSTILPLLLPVPDALTRCLYSLMASTLTLPILSLDSHSTMLLRLGIQPPASALCALFCVFRPMSGPS